MNEQITVLPDESLGGIQREYREVKRKAAVGERIVFDANSPGITAGKTYDVVGGDRDGAEFIDDDGDKRWQAHIPANCSVLEPSEIIRIGPERFRMVDRKAAVGERVIIVYDGHYARFENVVITEIDADGDALFDYEGEERYAKTEWYRVLELVESELSTRPATEQVAENIAALTAKVQALESRLAALEKEQFNTPKLAVTSPQKTPIKESAKTAQQIRDGIVERAKADVKALIERAKSGYTDTPATQRLGHLSVEFVTNREARTVAALLRLFHVPEQRKVYTKGIAKCAPNDVFNAHIGRAIALRRALGLDVPAEYLSVPGPEIVREGDIVDYGGRVATVALDGRNIDIDTHTFLSTANGCGAKIIDDTRDGAELSASSTKGVAA